MICISLPAPSITTPTTIPITTTPTSTTLPFTQKLFNNLKRRRTKFTGDYIHIQWTYSQEDSVSLCSSNYSDNSPKQSSCKRSSVNSSTTSLDNNSLIEDMFSNIEVWIAAHRTGKISKILEDREDIFENEESDEDLSWQVTLRPKYKYTLCDSFWI